MPGRTKDEVGVDANVESEAKGIGSDWGADCLPACDDIWAKWLFNDNDDNSSLYKLQGSTITHTHSVPCIPYTEIVIDQDLRCCALIWIVFGLQLADKWVTRTGPRFPSASDEWLR